MLGKYIFNKAAIFALIFTFYSIPAYADFSDWWGKWTPENKYLFTALLSAQVGDYTQSLKINNAKTVRDCQGNPIYDVSTDTIYRMCADRQMYIYRETNLLFSDRDRFNPTKLIISDTLSDVTILYLGTKYPKIQKPLLLGSYIYRLLTVMNNHSIGLKSDFPVLPVIVSFEF